MLNGLVVWFNDSKGFGLIESEHGQTVFVHYSAIQNTQFQYQNQKSFRSLNPGQKVTFDLYEDAAKGYFARNVILSGEV
jgi:CspA family cold shock protein